MQDKRGTKCKIEEINIQYPTLSMSIVVIDFVKCPYDIYVTFQIGLLNSNIYSLA